MAKAVAGAGVVAGVVAGAVAVAVAVAVPGKSLAITPLSAHCGPRRLSLRSGPATHTPPEQDMAQQVNLDELNVIGHILMGAAAADGTIDGDEAETILAIVGELLGDRGVPSDLKPHLRAFDAATFNLDEAAAQLHLSGPKDRRALLQLVARVTDADDVHDLRESDYIAKVAKAIGAAPSEYSALTIELTWISSLEPPPLPA